MPDAGQYDDPELKDAVGQFPQLYCAFCNPPRRLLPSESARCLDRAEPCWRPDNEICADGG